MSSQISTNRCRPGTSVARKIRLLPNGTSCPATLDQGAAPVVARGEPPALVELAVGRQVRLGRDPEDLAAVDHDRAVVEPVALPQRRADHEHRPQVARSPRPPCRWPPARRRAGCPAGTGRRSRSRSGPARGRPRRRRRRRDTRAWSRTARRWRRVGDGDSAPAIRARTRVRKPDRMSHGDARGSTDRSHDSRPAEGPRDAVTPAGRRAADRSRCRSAGDGRYARWAIARTRSEAAPRCSLRRARRRTLSDRHGRGDLGAAGCRLATSASRLGPGVDAASSEAQAEHRLAGAEPEPSSAGTDVRARP